MKQLKLSMHLAAVLAVSLGVLTAVPVYARAHAEDQTTTEPTSLQEVSKTEVQDRVAQFKSDATEKLTTERADKAKTTVAQRQTACENRQASLQKRVDAYSNAATTKLGAFDAVFTRVKAFKPDTQAKVANFSDLVAAATAKQTAAAESVSALKTLTVSFDCTSTDPAATVVAIKEAVNNVKAALKDYQVSLKNIVVALAQVNKTDTTKTTTDTNTTTGAN